MQTTCFGDSGSCSTHAEMCKTHTSSARPQRTCQLAQRSFHLHSGATALFTDGQLHEEEEDKEAGLLAFIFTVKPAVPLFSGSTSEPFLQFLRAHP